MKNIIQILTVGVSVLLLLVVLNYLFSKETVSDPIADVCTADVLECSDGSYVSRVAPSCEFAACPVIAEAEQPLEPEVVLDSTASLSVALGETTVIQGVSITPSKVVEDSRCPIDAQCIQAGTVKVVTTLATAVAHGEQTIELGKTQPFGDRSIHLLEVLPYKTVEDNSIEEYSFVYNVTE